MELYSKHMTGVTFMIILFILDHTVGLLWLSSSGFATSHLPGCLCRWTFSLNIRMSKLPSYTSTSCLYSLLEDPTWEPQALQLIFVVVFGAVD